MLDRNPALARYNEANGIVPRTILRSKQEIMEQTSIAYMMGKPTKQNYYIEPEKAELAADPVTAYMSKEELEKQLKLVQNNMEKAAKELDFIAAARLRDEMLALKKLLEKK